MDQGKLQAVVDNEVRNAIGFLETETTADRQKALKYYLREAYGNEVEGRSQIVTGEVAESVDGAMPQLLRIFTQSDNVVRFNPNNQGDEQGAKQATDYCNWVFLKQNEGIKIMHDWFKDALMQKVGVVKAYWDESEDVTIEKYQNLTQDELAQMLLDGTREIVSQESIEIDTGQINELGEPVIALSYNVEIKKKTTAGRVVVDNVPPEEFLISKKARTIKDAPFTAHRKLMSRSELVAMGFDEKVIETLPVYDDLDYSEGKIARYSSGEMPDQDSEIDKAMQSVEVYECYIKVDFDDDGIAEMRRVMYAGNEVLENEPCDYVPFHSICPMPVPHKFFGQSLADRTTDIQLIKSTVVRQMLDNLYLTNNARLGAVEGQVNLDDLLSVTPGGVIRMKNPNAVVPLSIQPVANQAFPMLEYLDAVQAKRTGVSDIQQGLDPNILQNVTAAAIAATTKAGAGKIELIARIFAETGVKSLFRGILHLVCKYQEKPKIIRLRNQYVQMDARQWDTLYDMDIDVGLGTGDKEEKMAMLQMVMAKQEQIIQSYGPGNPLVSVGQFRQALGDFMEASGIKDTTDYFNEITPEINQQLSQPAQENQVDPAVQVALAQQQAQLEIDRQKAEAEIEMKRLKAEADIQLAREKAAAEIELRKQEFDVEVRLKSMKLGAGITNDVRIPG